MKARIALLLCTLAWVLSLEPHLRRLTYLMRTGFDSPWPWLLDAPGLAALAWGLGLGGLLAAQVERIRLPAVALWLGATLFLAAHRLTGDDATFFGGIWTAAFVTWFVHAERVRPETTARIAPRLATWVAAALFFPAGTGKLVASYLDGTAFTELMGVDNPLLFDLMGLEAPDWFGVTLGRISAFVELSSPLWVNLPIRLALPTIAATVVSIMALWTIHLGSILLQLVGVVVLVWPTEKVG